MNGIFRNCINEDQRENAITALRNYPLPLQFKLQPPVPPKTAAQLRYMHSLCNALSAHHNVDPEIGKRDAKAEFGVVVVSTSLITGERSARLESFKDYTKEEAEAFCYGMEHHMSLKGIPFIASGDTK